MTYPPQQPEASGWSPHPVEPPPHGPKTGLIVGAVVAAAVIVIGGVTAWALWQSAQPEFAAMPTVSVTVPVPTTLCVYSPTPDQPAAKDVGTPDKADLTPRSGTVKVTLKTNHGDIALTLDRAKAPCAVQSLVFLAKKKYFDGSPCHRLTAISGFKVLQCGDPSGTGRGGPGYRFDDELPTDLKPADADRALYPTATVAMANAGPGTSDSQFFLVYGDTKIAPNYSVLGTYSAAGQNTMEKIAAGGVVQAPDSPVEGDGPPKTPVTIEQAVTEG